jgi:hypothetical protein
LDDQIQILPQPCLAILEMKAGSRNDTGTTNRFFSLSPTYIARWPFGTSANVEAACFANEFDRRRMFLACIIPGKRIAIAIYVCCLSEKDGEDHK